MSWKTKRSLFVLLIAILTVFIYEFASKIVSLFATPINNSITNQSISASLILAPDYSFPLYMGLIQSVLVIAGIVSGVSAVLLLNIIADKNMRKLNITKSIILIFAIFSFALPLFSTINAVGAIDWYTFFRYNTVPPNTYLNVIGWQNLCSRFNSTIMVPTGNGSSTSCLGVNNIYTSVITPYKNTLNYTDSAIESLFYGSLMVLITVFSYSALKFGLIT
jgi:hypothetical protein